MQCREGFGQRLLSFVATQTGAAVDAGAQAEMSASDHAGGGNRRGDDK